MALLNEAKFRYTRFQLQPAQSQFSLQALINEAANQLAWNSITPTLAGFPPGTSIASAVTGNANSSVFDYGNQKGGHQRDAALVRVVTTVGATPTCTYAIQGSLDNSTWTALNYADSATPTSFGTSTFVITTAGTVVKLVAPQVYRYLRVVFSVNTNVTNTVDVYPFGD